MNQFDSFIGNKDHAISKAASLLDSVTNDYQAKAITKAEYDELCGDILDYNDIVASITDMTRKQAIYDAFEALTSIVSHISSL